jgi:hypothetical protein
MSRPLKILFFVAIPGVLLVCLLPGLIWAAFAQADIEQHQSQVKSDWIQFKPQIGTDEARWKNDELFQVRKGEDASTVLFTKIRRDEVKTAPLIPEAIAEALKANKSTFVDHVDDVDVSSIDLSWMRQLNQFAYFDIEAGDPKGDSRAFHLFNEFFPNFLDLQNMAKVRLIQGLASGDARQAAKEVRELARLCFSSEQLICEMIGIAILGMEEAAFKEAQKRKQITDAWVPISENERLQMRRLFWVGLEQYTMDAPLEMLKEEKITIGSCAALREGIGTTLLMREFAPQDQKERLDALKQIADVSIHCRLKRERAALNGSLKAETFSSTADSFLGSDSVIPDFVLKLPGMKTVALANMFKVGTADYFQMYRDGGISF